MESPEVTNYGDLVAKSMKNRCADLVIYRTYGCFLLFGMSCKLFTCVQIHRISHFGSLVVKTTRPVTAMSLPHDT